jgi:hypothetical protein
MPQVALISIKCPITVKTVATKSVRKMAQMPALSITCIGIS